MGDSSFPPSLCYGGQASVQFQESGSERFERAPNEGQWKERYSRFGTGILSSLRGLDHYECFNP